MCSRPSRSPRAVREADGCTENCHITRLAQAAKQCLAHSRHSVSVWGINDYIKGYYGITDGGWGKLLKAPRAG